MTDALGRRFRGEHCGLWVEGMMSGTWIGLSRASKGCKGCKGCKGDWETREGKRGDLRGFASQNSIIGLMELAWVVKTR